MSISPSEQINRLKKALAEIRSNKETFSDESFAQIIMVLLEKLRRLQTILPTDIETRDEIRLVTVMFIDVKDSTEMIQQMEASDWKEIIAEAHERIAHTVALWDGQIGQYLGDGVLCFFGAQRSRGDDALHGVSCALQIQTIISEFAQAIHETHGIDFGIRIGISTGRVVVGMIGSESSKKELLALGSATNLAARLQGAAPVGAVLIDDTTYNRVRSDFVTQAQANIELKGFDEPVKNYRVLQRRTQPASHFTNTQIAGIEMPLVGRDEDLALINYLCDKTLQQRKFQVITLIGDIGMGKSRLLQEAVQLTDSHFLHIIMTSQYETRSKSQNLLWDMLMTQCNLSEDMSDELIEQQIVAYITEHWKHPDAKYAAAAIAYLAGFNFQSPEGNLFEWVLRWFEGVAEKHSILIAVDNLQWADEQSIALLEQITRRLAHSTGVLIAAGQADYQSMYPSYMADYPRHTIIKLAPLHYAATRMIIDRIFEHVERIPPTLAETINERVEGNPLFVQEYLGMLFDNNVFQRGKNGHWRFNILMLDTALNTLPNGLLSILQARLDDLSPEVRNIVQIAAVAGQTFWASAVDEIAESKNTRRLLEHLVLRGIIIKEKTSDFANELQYVFRHSLYREVAYKMIPRQKRERYHKRMSLWLLERVAGIENFYPLLAEQFQLSGEYTAALYSYMEAVQICVKRHQCHEALKLIDTSLGLANRVSRNDALPIVIKLWTYRGETLLELGRYDEASAASQSALMLLQELPADQLVVMRIQAERILGLANMRLGRYNDAYDALTRAHNALPYNATGQISSVLCAFGQLFYYQGRLEDSEAYQKRAYEHAMKTEDTLLIAAALAEIGAIEIERGYLTQAFQHFEQSLFMHRQIALVGQQSQDLFQLGIVHLAMLDYGKAYEYFSDADHLKTVFGQKDVLIQAYQALALIYLDKQTQGKGLLLGAIETGSHDIEIQRRLHLCYIEGLLALGDYVQVREQAMSFLQQTIENSLLRARAERFLAIASHELNTVNAVDILYSALKTEMDKGGRDTWLCHYYLANCLGNNESQEHYQKAAGIILERADSFQDYRDLREGFLYSQMVQHVLKQVGIDPLQLTG
jgi:class 3 adenylate cyclase/tetratricopeptide (TPR) repeat protein